VAITGLTSDGNALFPWHSKRRQAVISEKAAALNVPLILVKNSRAALATAAAYFYNYPAQKLKMVGVTGTNGKTTITYLIKAILEKAGIRTGLIGSITNYIGAEEAPAHFTTPESFGIAGAAG